MAEWNYVTLLIYATKTHLKTAQTIFTNIRFLNLCYKFNGRFIFIISHFQFHEHQFQPKFFQIRFLALSLIDDIFVLKIEVFLDPIPLHERKHNEITSFRFNQIKEICWFFVLHFEIKLYICYWKIQSFKDEINSWEQNPEKHFFC